jgi:hypothetical protein
MVRLLGYLELWLFIWWLERERSLTARHRYTAVRHCFAVNRLYDHLTLYLWFLHRTTVTTLSFVIESNHHSYLQCLHTAEQPSVLMIGHVLLEEVAERELEDELHAVLLRYPATQTVHYGASSSTAQIHTTSQASSLLTHSRFHPARKNATLFLHLMPFHLSLLVTAR